MWWWSGYGPTPWMFVGPIMMLVFMAICLAGMFFNDAYHAPSQERSRWGGPNGRVRRWSLAIGPRQRPSNRDA
jgi:hypothetical protein